MAKAEIEVKIDRAIEQVANIHFQAIRGESKDVVLKALDEVEEAIIQAKNSVNNM
ncbi:hypothetical protein [Weissella minor]|uniref:Uncharacterized protein n=1 Tax=Weissella minor TaxID=1620 RepID=A0A0R2JRM3_9LACO|nr:hypothetical protein [Weissella minor]KRN77242.1 hypothetical protein IV67_GL000027 [Weissella minor]